MASCKWKCKHCNLLNAASSTQCQACTTQCSDQDRMLPYIEKRSNAYWKDITTIITSEFIPFTEGQDAQELIAVILEHVGTDFDDEFLNHSYFGYEYLYKSVDINYSKRSCKVMLKSHNSVDIHETYAHEDKWGRADGMMNFDIVGEYFIDQVVSNNKVTEYMLKMMVKANGYDNNDTKYNDVLIGLQCKVVCNKVDESKKFVFSEREIFSSQFQEDCRCCDIDSQALDELRQIPLGSDIPVVKTGNHSAIYNEYSDPDDEEYNNYDGNMDGGMYGGYDDWEDYIDDVYGNCYHDD